MVIHSQNESAQNDSQLQAPVLFMIFNRPWETRMTFEVVRQVRPQKLFIASDGPRFDKPGERTIVEHVRKDVLDNIDWPCEVNTLFRKENLGCKKAVIGAIDWFFANVDSGIILEDDCRPSPSFFWFCQVLLERYEHDNRIWHITGDNFQQTPISDSADYFFSRYPHIWGWATWRSRWQANDGDLKTFDEKAVAAKLTAVLGHRFVVDYWTKILRQVKNGDIDTWDYQWMYSVWMNKGLTIAPNRNLISNIGFNQLATHTRHEQPGLSNLEVSDVSIPLRHPSFIAPDVNADEWIAGNLYREPTTLERVMRKLKTIMKPVMRAAVT